MALSDTGLVFRYGLSESSFTQFDDAGPNAAHLDSNAAGSVLTAAGTTPHKYVHCSTDGGVGHLARYLADSGDAIRTALEGKKKITMVMKLRWGTVADDRTLWALNQWSANYGDSRLAMSFRANKLMPRWLDGDCTYANIDRIASGDTVFGLYTFHLNTDAASRLTMWADTTQTGTSNSGVTAGSTLTLPVDMQISLFGSEGDVSGWNGNAPQADIAYFALYVDQDWDTTRQTAEYDALATDDDSFGVAFDPVLGVDPIVFTGDAGDQTVSVTVPPTANAFIIGATFYTGSAQSAAFTGPGWMTVQSQELDSARDWMNGLSALGKVTATGVQTLHLNASTAFVEGPAALIVWLQVDNPNDWVLDFLRHEQTASPEALSTTVNAVTDGEVLSFIGKDGNDVLSAPSGTTQVGSTTNNLFDYQMVVRANTVAPPTVSVAPGTYQWPTLFSVSIKAQTGAAPDVTAPITSGLTATPTSSSLVNGAFATDEPGTGYFLVSSNATEVAATVEAGANSAAATIESGCSFTGLTWTTGQYLHAVQKDEAATPNWSSVLSLLIADAAAPVATGPLTITNVVPTGCRVGGFSATDNLAVTGWRYRLDSGSWVTFGDGASTFFDLTGLTTDASVLVEVQARDAAGNWSNTLSKTFTVGATTITLTGLLFPDTTPHTSGQNLRLKQINPPPRASCTLMWMEWRESQDQYSGGVILSGEHSSWSAGVGEDVCMAVTHGCTGAFESSGQRTTGAASPMYHELAGMNSAVYGTGLDYIASNSALVQAGETQQSFLAEYGSWKRRVLIIETVGSTVTHKSYLDYGVDNTKILRQNIATTDLANPADARVYIGAPPWIADGTENFRGKIAYLKSFSRALSLAEVDSEFGSWSNTPVVSDAWFSNIFPAMSGSVLPDLKGSGTAHDITNDSTATPSAFSEEYEVATTPPINYYLVT